MNERNLYKILQNTMLSQNYHIFRINSKKKILSMYDNKRVIIRKHETIFELPSISNADSTMSR